MAKKLEIEWNHKGFEQILCSTGAKVVCNNIGDRISEEANAKTMLAIAAMTARASSGDEDEGNNLRITKSDLKNLKDGKGGFYSKPSQIVDMYGSRRAAAIVKAEDKFSRIAESEYKVLSSSIH